MREKKEIQKRGRKPGPRPSREAVLRLYIAGRLSLREVGDALGISKDQVRRLLDVYDVEPRQNFRRGKLADIPLELLEANVKAKGLRGFAREVGVAPATLIREIRKRRAT